MGHVCLSQVVYMYVLQEEEKVQLLVQIPHGAAGFLSLLHYELILVTSVSIFATNYETIQVKSFIQLQLQNRIFSFLTPPSFNLLKFPFKNVLGYDLHGWLFPELTFSEEYPFI